MNEGMIHKAAALTAKDTKTAAREALKQVQLSRNDTNVAAVLVARREHVGARVNRVRSNIEKRLGHVPVRYSPYRTVTPRYVLPSGTPTQRLYAAKKRAVVGIAKQAFRNGAAGGSSFTVHLVNDPNDVEYHVTIDFNRDTYKGAYKGWLSREDHHIICVPSDWRVRVLGNGIALCDGLMTLDAHQLEAPPGMRLFAAKWAEQGRGYAVQAREGYLALLSNVTFHAATREAAIAGVQRKFAVEQQHLLNVAAVNESVDAFIRRFEGAEVTVSVHDARATGSCEYGIRAWCNAVGFDPLCKRAPIQDVLEAFRRRPQIEVRYAVLHAVRRARRNDRSPT